MKDLHSLETFSEVFSAILTERDIQSDEFLARKAMRSQDTKGKRINVQRKTINNWRNGRSRPRSIDDRQFQLILKALEVNDRELSVLSKFFKNQPASQDTDIQSMPKEAVPSSRSESRFLLMLASLVLLFGGLAIFAFFSLTSEPPASGYFSEIPKAELNLSNNGFVLPQSDKEVISNKDLNKLSGWELYVARNEIFARKGRGFWLTSSVCLQNHFDSMANSPSNPNGWYDKRPKMAELSGIEARNARAIRTFECQVRGGQFKCNGRLNKCE